MLRPFTCMRQQLLATKVSCGQHTVQLLPGWGSPSILSGAGCTQKADGHDALGVSGLISMLRQAVTGQQSANGCTLQQQSKMCGIAQQR